MSSNAPSTVKHPSATQMIRRHADWLAMLPATFPREMVPTEYQGEFRSLRRTPVFEVVGEEPVTHHSSRKRSVYALSEWAVELLAETIRERDTVCPCGHSGVKNHGDYYECSFDLCGREFDRDELEVARDDD